MKLTRNRIFATAAAATLSLAGLTFALAPAASAASGGGCSPKGSAGEQVQRLDNRATAYPAQEPGARPPPAAQRGGQRRSHSPSLISPGPSGLLSGRAGRPRSVDQSPDAASSSFVACTLIMLSTA